MTTTPAAESAVAVALVTLDTDEIVPWAGEHGLRSDLARLSATRACVN